MDSYIALGLQHTLNPISSGGTEVGCVKIGSEEKCSSDIPKGFGRIIRDENGAVVGVELGEEEEEIESGDIEGPCEGIVQGKWFARSKWNLGIPRS